MFAMLPYAFVGMLEQQGQQCIAQPQAYKLETASLAGPVCYMHASPLVAASTP